MRRKFFPPKSLSETRPSMSMRCFVARTGLHERARGLKTSPDIGGRIPLNDFGPALEFCSAAPRPPNHVGHKVTTPPNGQTTKTTKSQNTQHHANHKITNSVEITTTTQTQKPQKAPNRKIMKPQNHGTAKTTNSCTAQNC